MKRIKNAVGTGCVALAMAGAGLIGLTIPCGIAVVSAGCMTVTTTGTNGSPQKFTTLDTNAVISAINLVVPSGVALACAKDTNAIPYFGQVSIVLKTLAQSGTVDPTLVQASLSSISIRQLRSPTAIQAENAAIALYNTFAAQAVLQQVNRVAWLQPVLAALGNAIQLGLPGAMAVAPSPVANVPVTIGP